jgi:hypothetical protein
MTRGELVKELELIRRIWDEDDQKQVTALIERIKEEGVLDVQCPPEIAEMMDLPRSKE